MYWGVGGTLWTSKYLDWGRVVLWTSTYQDWGVVVRGVPSGPNMQGGGVGGGILDLSIRG